MKRMARSTRRFSPLLVFSTLPLMVLCASLHLRAEENWWNPAWTVRRPIEIRPTGSAVSGNETGVVAFRGLNRLAKEGQDIRIVSEGQPVPLKVLHAGNDEAVVAFRMARQAKAYWVYYGNPKAPALTAQWEPERGLWLETRRYNSGECNNWPQMRELIEKSGPVFGADLVPNVFCGWNPFSADDRWVSIYKGFLHCSQAGEYTFCTSSEDASFLFVDDRLVTQFPGWHMPENRAKFTDKLQLTAGVHPFAYYHVNRSGTGVMAAYWQPPGAERIAPIPASAFTPVARGRAGLQDVRGEASVDMETALLGEAYVGERVMLRIRFRARSAKALRKVCWSFGDGQTAEGEIVEHIYLRQGSFPVQVTAEAADRKVQADTTFNAHIDYNRQTETNKDPPKPYLEAVRKYDLEHLDPASLEVLSVLWFIVEDADGQLATAQALLARPQTSVPLYFEQAMRMQSLLRDRKKDPDGALAILTAAEERLKNDKNLRAKILREIGDVYYYHKHDLDRALLEYDKVVGRYFGLEDNIVRVTKIRIGDIMRERGNYDKAARNYAEAEQLRIDKWSPEQQPVRLGMLVHATEDYLHRGDAAEARKWLEILEWEFPLERLRGQSTILRAKIALAEKDAAEAVKQLEALVRVNPESQYVGEALYLLAEQALTRKDLENAKKLLRDLVDHHPDSEQAPKGEKLLAQLEGHEAPGKTASPVPARDDNQKIREGLKDTKTHKARLR